MLRASNLYVKARIFRRRHKLLLTASLIVTIVLVLIGCTKGQLSEELTSGIESTINNPDLASSSASSSFLAGLLGTIFMAFQKKKTIPFAETGAAQQNEFQSIIKATSSSPLRSMSDETKLKLIIESHKRIDPDNKNLKKGHKFYEQVFDVLTKAKPKMEKPLDKYLTRNRIYHARYQYSPEDEDNEVVFSEKYLSQFLQLDDEELKIMTDSHKYVVDNLKNEAPDGLYKGNGIVFVGGGKFNWLTLLSIKSIRAIGSELPIEVLIPEMDEYEPDLCARVFPALKARCIYLPHVLSDGYSPIADIKFYGYQYKALAIMLLSFENILLLDSDNIPVYPPDYLFDLEPFVSRGLIVWPDFWKRATSPDYYRIAGIKVDDKQLLPKYNEKTGQYEQIEQDKQLKLNLNETPLHQRIGGIPDPTSESGQLMISKKTHMKALLLALYYNMYGPNHYYPLFSQGSDGEGDKETFLAATVALKRPFYQVSKFLNAFGYFNTKSEFIGTGMGQYDPAEDYTVNMKRNNLKGKSEVEISKILEKDSLLLKGPRILFVHANFPKLNPWLLKKERKIINEDDERLRLYGTGMKLRTGYDFETVQWSNMKFLLCELKIDLKAYQEVDRDELCAEINDHLKFLKSTIDTLE